MCVCVCGDLSVEASSLVFPDRNPQHDTGLSAKPISGDIYDRKRESLSSPTSSSPGPLVASCVGPATTSRSSHATPRVVFREKTGSSSANIASPLGVRRVAGAKIAFHHKQHEGRPVH